MSPLKVVKNVKGESIVTYYESEFGSLCFSQKKREGGEQGHSGREYLSVSSVHSCAQQCDKNNMWHFVSLHCYLLRKINCMEKIHCFIYLKDEHYHTSEKCYISNATFKLFYAKNTTWQILLTESQPVYKPIRNAENK